MKKKPRKNFEILFELEEALLEIKELKKEIKARDVRYCDYRGIHDGKCKYKEPKSIHIQKVNIYQQTIDWTDIYGNRSKVLATSQKSFQDAKNIALTLAKQSGYTYPKWWEFWRWREMERSKG